MLSDRQLAHWFHKYNRDYFNSELPPTVVYWESVPASEAISCPVFEVSDNSFEIKIDPVLKGLPRQFKITLLHELCHLKLWRKHPKHQHGRLFQDEMLRLANAGAFRKLW